MSSFISKLNLRPSELRLVVVVASVVVVVLYALFIYPQFKEWSALQKKKESFELAIGRFRAEIARSNYYATNLAALKDKGARVESESQALELQRKVTHHAAQHGVSVSGYTAGRGPAGSGGKTNQFFEEQTGTINYIADENALVNFLFALSSDESSLIRVSSMTLNPEPNRMKLMGNITVVASYRKPPPKAAVAVAPPVGGGVRPAPAGTGPKSISAAVTVSSRPAATNQPPKVSYWSRVKNLFSPGKSTKAPATSPAPSSAKPPAKTNAPAARK